ncbi:MAG: hypothetical protein M1817_004905 [Caeruleum heppii]|nr:MAG: hypothetical protein M1817_004905 [Caeruleum heppii]
MSAAAQQYQESLSKYQERRDSSAQLSDAPPVLNGPSDAVPTDIKQEPQQSGTPPELASNASTAAPVTHTRTSTPSRNVNGTTDTGARTIGNAEVASTMPVHPVEHGAPFRSYLNSRVTPSLLEGMKQLGLEQ